MDKENQIKIFLQQFMVLFDEGKINFRFNRKTALFLREIGWTANRATQYVRNNIKVEDYCTGPTPHHQRPHNLVFVFGMQLFENEIYVKLSIDTQEEDCACMSFHPAERPLEYPLRGGK